MISETIGSATSTYACYGKPALTPFLCRNPATMDCLSRDGKKGTMRRKCTLKSSGNLNDAVWWPGGAHELRIYHCDGRDVSLSLTCCPCSLPNGSASQSCVASAHYARW